MGGILHITELESHTLTIALDLEYAGFTAAAGYLRNRIKALRPIWEAQAEEDKAARPRVPATDLFRVHRGSLPPQPAAQPTLIQPAIRPDQITSSQNDR